MSSFQILLLGLFSFFFITLPMWKIFEKADEAWWIVFIPIYREYVLIKIVGLPGWFFILLLIPVIDLLIYALILILLAESFDKGLMFGIAMVFLPFVFLPILGYGNDDYLGPAGSRFNFG